MFAHIGIIVVHVQEYDWSGCVYCLSFSTNENSHCVLYTTKSGFMLLLNYGHRWNLLKTKWLN